MRKICYVKQGDIVRLKNNTIVVARQDYWKGGSIHSTSETGSDVWVSDCEIDKVLFNTKELKDTVFFKVNMINSHALKQLKSLERDSILEWITEPTKIK